MSATLGGGLGDRLVELMAGHGGEDPSGQAQETRVPLVVSEGRSYPVKTVHLGGPARRERFALERLAAHTIEDALQTDEGDVLCFLPGACSAGQRGLGPGLH